MILGFIETISQGNIPLGLFVLPVPKEIRIGSESGVGGNWLFQHHFAPIYLEGLL